MKIKIALYFGLPFLFCLILAYSCESPVKSSDEANPFIERHSLVVGGDTELEYWLLLPESFDPTQVYPAVLTFPPGTQSLDQVEWAINFYYIRQSIRRNWLIISPAAPDGIKFFEGAEQFIPRLLDEIENNFQIEENKFHLAGISNGGISAFRVGTLYPERFQSMTVFPGIPSETDKKHLQNLQSIPVTMYVGASDTEDWISQTEQTAYTLDSLGTDVFYQKWQNNGHVITSLTPADLFDLFESYRLQAKH